MLFDTHAHLNDRKYNKDLKEVISNAFENGVNNIVINGYDIKSSHKAIEIAEKYEGVYATVGIHPGDVDSVDFNTFNIIENLVKHEKVVAIGEIGLDYHYDTNNYDLQKDVFIKQLEIAQRLNVPVTIHSRDALQDTFNVLQLYDVKGIMHCYSGSVEMAKKFIDLGYYISIAGPVTFNNAKIPKQVVKEIPLDKLLIETDCPYLTPIPFRGKRNEPAYVEYVAKEVAYLRDISFEEVCKVTTENAFKAYNIKE